MYVLENVCRETEGKYAPLCIYYRKCPKIMYTEVSDKMAYTNSADPDQTAPLGAV